VLVKKQISKNSVYLASPVQERSIPAFLAAAGISRSDDVSSEGWVGLQMAKLMKTPTMGKNQERRAEG
jgi:hypothetical protein